MLTKSPAFANSYIFLQRTTLPLGPDLDFMSKHTPSSKERLKVGTQVQLIRPDHSVLITSFLPITDMSQLSCYWEQCGRSSYPLILLSISDTLNVSFSFFLRETKVICSAY